MSKIKDITGKKFNRLLVLSFNSIKNHQSCWLCKCDCGKEKIVRADTLKNGKVKSCGCLHDELFIKLNRKHSVTHNLSKSPEFAAWSNMKSRCINPKNHAYKHYGKRGITVCKEWLESFETFIKDMGFRPSVKHSLDRKDNNGNYTLENCRWATKSEQRINQRSKKEIQIYQFS